MKSLVVLGALSILSGCTAISLAPKPGEGTVVFSTSYTEDCKSAVNNGILPVSLVGSDEFVKGGVIRNPLIKQDIEENNTTIHVIAVPEGKYEFDEIVKPNVLFPAFKKDHYPYYGDPYGFEVKADKVSYIGNVLFHEIHGSCTKAYYEMEVSDQEERDLAIAKEKYPKFFVSEEM